MEVFIDVHKCTEYISATGIKRIFLIVSGTYGDDFDIKLFEQIIHDVYIYILTLEKFEANNNHGNVRGIFNNGEMLISQICDDYGTCTTDQEIEKNSLRMNTNLNTTRSLNPQIIQWKCWQLMINIFRQMSCPPQESMSRFIQLCKSRYRDNLIELRRIDQFETVYQANEAIRWYTATCFLYRILNRVSRNNNIDLMMDSSAILIDIHNQLNCVSSAERGQEAPLSVVYRGTRMGVEELLELRLNIGRFVSNSSLLSTFKNCSLAELFLGEDLYNNITSVLLEIFMNSNSVYSRPVASVERFSHIPEEGEVLFTNGHIFRVDSCDIIGKNQWRVRLTLCDESDAMFQNMSDYFDVAILQLLEILPNISPRTNKANDRMLQWWHLYSANDPIEQTKMKQFEENYRSDSAIRWYTKDSVLYRLLNMALRQENIDMIIDFRCFIIDLHEELTKSHVDYVRSCRKRHLTVFRGQKISPMELRRLQHTIGNYFCTNSMFSTSLSSQVALLSAELNESDRRQSLQSVLFQIDIDLEKLTRSGKNSIFANIMEMSCIIDEEEVLFMTNTQFRVESVAKHNDSLWHVSLTLLDHEDENNRDIQIMNRYLHHLTNVITQNYPDVESIRSFFLNLRQRRT